MDIKLKRFTLNTIAAAILTLNAESAFAISCPSQITGTALSGIVCDFDVGSSVTVQNGGEVGGISMISRTPLIPSHITINAGGLISNTTGIGISISNSSLSNGLLNAGTISITSGSGIVISNSSTINGGLTNTGLITTSAGGITINQSTINDGISNQGIINSTAGTGILIRSSNINGGITNSGTISSGGAFVGLTIDNNTTINGDINNTGLIEATGSGNGILMRSNSVIAGGIFNTGTIRSSLNEGISILNVSNVQGNIVNNGTISGGNNGVSVHNGSTVGGSIVNNGTITGEGGRGISIFSATTVSGNISNTGTVRGGTTGIGILSTSTVSGGLSNSGVIQGDLFAIRIDSNSNVADINITGSNARVIGSVEAVNTNFNITSGAVFTSEGSFNVNTFNISSNATFNMANTITANSVNNSGTLAIQNTTQTIAGNYTQNTGGQFQLGLTNKTNYGALVATGTVDLSQSGKINVQLANNASLHAGDVMTNVISGSVLINPVTGYQVSDDSFIWKFTANTNNTNNGINLVANINPVASAACQGMYCQGAANAILNQVAAGNSAFNAFALLTSESEFTKAAAQATPELTNENVGATQITSQAVMDVVPMWGTLHGKSAGDTMLSDPGKIWLKPYGATIIQDKNSTVDGYSATSYGIVLGKDIDLADWLFGGALTAGKENLTGKAQLSGQKIHADVYQGLLYGARKLSHNVYFAAQGLVGYGNNDTIRSIPLYASTADGSYNSWFTNVRAQLGWSNYELHQNFILTPLFDASYFYINQGSYRESGSPMDLSVDSNSNSTLTLGAYANGAYHLTEVNKLQYVTLTGYAGFARNLFNNQSQTTATFIAGGPSFSTVGVQFDKTVFRGGFGLNIENPGKPLKANINYDMQTGNNAYAGMGSVTIAYKL